MSIILVPRQREARMIKDRSTTGKALWHGGKREKKTQVWGPGETHRRGPHKNWQVPQREQEGRRCGGGGTKVAGRKNSAGPACRWAEIMEGDSNWNQGTRRRPARLVPLEGRNSRGKKGEEGQARKDTSGQKSLLGTCPGGFQLAWGSVGVRSMNRRTGASRPC